MGEVIEAGRYYVQRGGRNVVLALSGVQGDGTDKGFEALGVNIWPHGAMLNPDFFLPATAEQIAEAWREVEREWHSVEIDHHHKSDRWIFDAFTTLQSALEAANKRIEELTAENFALAAGQCCVDGRTLPNTPCLRTEADARAFAIGYLGGLALKGRP